MTDRRATTGGTTLVLGNNKQKTLFERILKTLSSLTKSERVENEPLVGRFSKLKTELSIDESSSNNLVLNL
jgi:hypothetical protein